jgi:hypothetical protein
MVDVDSQPRGTALVEWTPLPIPQEVDLQAFRLEESTAVETPQPRLGFLLHALLGKGIVFEFRVGCLCDHLVTSAYLLGHGTNRLRTNSRPVRLP